LIKLQAESRKGPMVNLYEFGVLASVWSAHDPEDPESAGIPPENMALWTSDAKRCNFSVGGQSHYAIDLADLASFVENAPWPVVPGLYQGGGSGEMLLMAGEGLLLTGFEATSLEVQAAPEQLTSEKMGHLVNVIGQLETIWLTDPDIQQEVDGADWLLFMEALYGELIEACMNSR